MSSLTLRKWSSNRRSGIKEDSDHTKAKFIVITARTLQGMSNLEARKRGVMKTVSFTQLIKHFSNDC